MNRVHHLQIEPGEIGKHVLLTEDFNRCKLIARHFKNPKLIANNREYITFTGKYKGLLVSVTSTGMGCPSSAIALEELIMSGATFFIQLGTTKALQKNIELGELVIPTSAVRMDGTSLEYVPIEFPAVADNSIANALINISRQKKQKFHEGTIMSHDAFYKINSVFHSDDLKRENVWVNANVLSVDNESSALFTIGYLRNARVGTLLTVTENLQTPYIIKDNEEENHYFHLMTDICLEAFNQLEDINKH